MFSYRSVLSCAIWLCSTFVYGALLHLPQDFISSNREYIHTAVVISAQDHNGIHQVGSSPNLASGRNNRLKFQVDGSYLSLYEVTNNTTGHTAPVLRYSITQQSADEIVIDVSSEHLGSPYYALMSQFLHAQWVSLLQSRVINTPTLEDGFFSFQTEEIFVPHFRTANRIHDNKNGHPVSIQVQHSFLRVDDRNYHAKPYHLFEQERFGFFTTSEGRNSWINRFDLASDKTVTYYVDRELMQLFGNEVNAAFQAWNDAFAKALPHRTTPVLQVSQEDKSHGDPRYSTLTLVRENGGNLAGFGPSIVDSTGEIISGHAYIWEQAIRHTREHVGRLYDLYHGQSIESYRTHPLDDDIERYIENLTHHADTDISALFESLDIRAHASRVEETPQNQEVTQWSWVSQDIKDYFSEDTTTPKNPALSMGCQHQQHAEFFHSTSSARDFFDFYQNKSKEEVLDLFQARMVTQLILHEVGHTLGLTHNFYGTYDSSNFRASENNEPASFYSSSTVMDYSQTFDHLQPRVGLYDVAALRYGYGDLIEIQNEGTITKAEMIKRIETIKGQNPLKSYQEVARLAETELNVKPYLYCMMPSPTDPRCQAFSKGTQYHEIAQNVVDNYELNALYMVHQKDLSPQLMPSLGKALNTLHMILGEFQRKSHTQDFNEEGAGSLSDFVTAIVTSIKFMIRVLETVEPGDYHLYNEQFWLPGQGDENAIQLQLPLGPGRYLYPDYTMTPRGQMHVLRSGMERQKIEVLELLTRRTAYGASFMDLDHMFQGVLSNLFFKIIRGEWFTALPTSVDEDGRHQYAQDPEKATYHYGVQPSQSEKIRQWATTLAVSRFFTTPEQFEAMIDFRLKGEDRIYKGKNVDKIEVPSFSRSVQYVVPQNKNKNSLAYAIAEKIQRFTQTIEELNLLKAKIVASLEELEKASQASADTRENQVETDESDEAKAEAKKQALLAQLHNEMQKQNLVQQLKMIEKKTANLQKLAAQEEQRMLLIRKIFKVITGVSV